MHVALTFDPLEDVAAPFINKARPMAILREQGVNSHVEMSYAVAQGGFDTFDVHMSDLQAGRVSLDQFQGFIACGGFSYGDTLGAGEGWARSIMFNPKLEEQFLAFFGRQDTFALGVCNGCQMLAALSPIIPGAQDWPKFTHNQSTRFEARLSLVEVLESPSLFFKGHGWQPACRSPCRTAKVLPISRSVATSPRCRKPALRGQHRCRHRGVSVQPERLARRFDQRDHGRWPLHRHDAAP